MNPTTTPRLRPMARILLILLAILMSASVTTAPATAATNATRQGEATSTEDPALNPDQDPDEIDSAKGDVAAPSTGVSIGGFDLRSAPIASLDEATAARRIDKNVAADLTKGTGTEAIIVLNAPAVVESASGAGAAALVDEAQPVYASVKKSLLAELGDNFEVLTDYDQLPMIHVRFTSPQGALQVAQSGLISYIDGNSALEMTTAESLNLVRQPAVVSAGYKGAGTYVAVLDSGVNYGQADFGNCSGGPGTKGCRVAYAHDFAPDDGRRDASPDKHGTNVAGIVARTAPGTKILALDIFTGDSANNAHTLDAVNWVIRQRRNGVNVVAMNLSIGGGNFPGTCDFVHPALDRAFEEAYALKIMPVVAAGNSGQKNGIAFPACLSHSLSVGNVYDSNVGRSTWLDELNRPKCTDSSTRADKVVCGSQSSAKLSMWAPGAIITAGGTSLGGTSQAAPHVAGAVAILRAAKPGASPAEMWNALTHHGPQVSDVNGVSRRRLDITAAINSLGVGSRPSVAFTQAVFKPGSRASTSNQLPVRVSWRGSDDVGIARYALFVRKNGGDWMRLELASKLATRDVRLLSAGDTWEFAVRAFDAAGNKSKWSFRTVKPLARNEASRFVKKSVGWTTTKASGAYGGKYMWTETDNAWTKYTFTGTNVAIIAPKYANAGNLVIYVDGKKVKTVSLDASKTRHRTVVFSWAWKRAGKHTVKVYADVSSSRPTVSIDAFAVIR